MRLYKLSEHAALRLFPIDQPTREEWVQYGREQDWIDYEAAVIEGAENGIDVVGSTAIVAAALGVSDD